MLHHEECIQAPMKDDLIARVLEILKEAGFIVSRRCEARSFDLAARRSELTVLAKIMRNIDGMTEEVAKSIKRAAFCLLASPLVVGERTGTSLLEDDVVYHRYNIPALNTHTLYDYFVEGVQPYVYSATRGLYVTIDGDAMRQAREKKEISLGEIASQLGLSRRSVSLYEEGGMSTSIEIALKLEEILETMLIKPLEVFSTEAPSSDILKGGVEGAVSSLEKDILGMMEEIGFEILPMAHAPFSAVSFPEPVSKARSEGTKILTGISRYTERLIKRARIVSSVSQVTGTKSVFVVNGTIKRVQIDTTVLFEKEELKRIRDPDEFTSVMEERTKD
ncbi:MAG: transcriptional regulator [Methanophagales archaeon ANME-1-THS]|nr:MAG: transcriptional regulator [Methanophagales archaeon ANME-1-THS]